MVNKIRSTSSTEPIIHNTSKTERRLDPNEVTKVLGAELCDEYLSTRVGPITLFALRQELAKRIYSPKNNAKSKKKNKLKITIDDQQRRKLDELAAKLSENGKSYTTDQLASALFAVSLDSAGKPK